MFKDPNLEWQLNQIQRRIDEGPKYLTKLGNVKLLEYWSRLLEDAKQPGKYDYLGFALTLDNFASGILDLEDGLNSGKYSQKQYIQFLIKTNADVLWYLNIKDDDLIASCRDFLDGLRELLFIVQSRF